MELMIYHDDEEKTTQSRIKMIQLSRSNIVIFFSEEARRELLLKTAPVYIYIYTLNIYIH